MNKKELKFRIYGGGDYSVGIPNVNAEITIKENVIYFSDEDIDRWRETIAEFYDIHKGCVMTQEEWDERLRLEEEMMPWADSCTLDEDCQCGCDGGDPNDDGIIEHLENEGFYRVFDRDK